MTRVLLAALAATVVLAGPASAATVEVRYETVRNQWRLVYVASPGEGNDVRLRKPDEHTVHVHDPAVQLAAGERCRRIDDHTAECGVPPGDRGIAPGDHGVYMAV